MQPTADELWKKLAVWGPETAEGLFEMGANSAGDLDEMRPDSAQGIFGFSMEFISSRF